ncbi:MAG: hypothetical protein WKF45_03950 [Ilumatobacteraceae bacterium]
MATIFQHLRAAVRAAHLDGVIGRDPSVRVKLPQPVDDRLGVPTVDEVLSLQRAAPDEFEVAVVLGAALGLRAGEQPD